MKIFDGKVESVRYNSDGSVIVMIDGRAYKATFEDGTIVIDSPAEVETECARMEDEIVDEVFCKIEG